MGEKEQRCVSPEHWGGRYKLDNKKGNNSASVALPSSQNDHSALVWCSGSWPGVAQKIKLSLFSSKKMKIHSSGCKQDSWIECREPTAELSFSFISNYMKDWALFLSFVFDFLMNIMELTSLSSVVHRIEQKCAELQRIKSYLLYLGMNRLTHSMCVIGLLVQKSF